MATQNKYRFYIINGCDVVGGAYSCTGIAQGTNTILTLTGHNLVAGQIIKLVDFVPSAGNIITEILSVTTNTIQIEKLPSIDETVFGTVYVLAGKRYVDPLNFYNTKFVWEKDNGKIFFRKKLAGKLTFNNPDSSNNDWSYFLANILPNSCCQVLFVIEKRCEGSWVEEWNGYFTNTDGRWNLSHCKVETEITVDDLYTCLTNNESDKVNILPKLDVNTVFIQPDITIEQFECCEDNVNVPGFSYQGSYGNCADLDLTSFGLDITGASWIGRTIIECNGIGADQAYSIIKTHITIDAITDPLANNAIVLTGRVCTTYIREVLVTIDLGGLPNPPDTNGGNDWYELESLIINGYPATKWARSPSDCPAGAEGWAQYVIANGLGGFTQTRFGDCDAFEVVYPSCYVEPTPVEFTQGINFGDASSYVASKFCPKIQGVRSDFFEINPPGDTTGYVAGTNYVTGLANKLKNMLIFQKSDVLYPAAIQHAFIGEITFAELQAIWRIAFNAYWFIDDDGYVRVEHISWFNRVVAIDTTTTANQNDRRNKSLQEFFYDKEKIPVRELYSWMEQNDIDFVGTPIKYSSACANPKNEEHNDIPNVTTDVNLIFNIPSSISLEGFVLVCVDQDDNTVIDREEGLLTGTEKNNAHLSWANLHYAYHRHDRWLLSGTMNGEAETFLTAKKTKRQVPICYIGDCCVEIDPLTDLITSELGDGQIDKLTKDNRDELFTIELLFD